MSSWPYFEQSLISGGNTGTRQLSAEKRSAHERIKQGEAALAGLRASVEGLYESGGITEKDITEDVLWHDKGKDRKLIDRLLRAVVLEDKFVIAVGGMSDVAGHGNRASDSYPMVFLEALKPAMEVLGVELVVRNFAMGGVPSFPHSVCMVDVFGPDVDLIIWDFRMVENDAHKGELYIRQALLMPRNPIVMFKRENSYLAALAKAGYGDAAGLHVLDETPLLNKLHEIAVPSITNDTFCRTPCNCPGQVRWHGGWKSHRLRGLQMAMVYGRILAKALEEFKGLVGTGQDIERVTQMSRWFIAPMKSDELPSLQSTVLQPVFADHVFRCGLTWSPHHGRDLTSLVDTSSQAKGGTKWSIKDPASHISDLGKTCGYLDDKAELEGTVDDGWVFFTLQGVSAKGTVGFCADIPKGNEKRLTDYDIVVLINGEEVQRDMEYWMDSRTLGISIQCYGTTKMVREGKNEFGFRVMETGVVLKITHVIWR